MSTAPTTIYIQTSQPQPISKGMNKWKNGPQSHSLIAAHFILIYGGMQFALGMGFASISSQHSQLSWFIGVIIGAVLAAPLVNFLLKKILFGFSALLSLTSGIIFTSAPSELESIIAARYLSGIAVGITMVAMIVDGSEISSRTYRGTCLSAEQFSLTLGITIQVIASTQWSVWFPINRFIGILGIIFAFIALITVYFIIESPVFYLRKCDENLALQSLKVSVRPQIVDDNLRSRLDELKAYVMENEDLGFGTSFVKGFLPLLKMLLYRSCVAFTFSIPLNTALVISSIINTGTVQGYPLILFVVLRLLGASISTAVMDPLGRKLIPLFSLIVAGALTIGVASIFNDFSNIADTYKMTVSLTLILIAQFFNGMFTPSSSVYLGEAFPLLVKSYFISVSICIQELIQIIVICTLDLAHISDALFAFGIISVVLAIVFLISVPETKNTTLRDAQERFSHVFYSRLT